MAFKDNLRRLRKAVPLTQEQLALACGWSGQSRVANYEKGAREPSLAEVEVLAKALRTTPAALLGDGSTAGGDAANRLRMTEDMVAALNMALAVTLRTVAAQAPELGRALAHSLGALKGSSGSQRQVLEGAADAVAAGLESWESAAPRVGPTGSPGKRSRTGR